MHEVDAEIINHWKTRVSEVTHPVMLARYADLAWDLERPVTGCRPDPLFARRAAEGYLAAVDLPFEATEEDNVIFQATWLKRALGLGLSLADEGLAGKGRDAMLLFFRKVAVPGRPGTWAFVFDCLYENTKLDLSSSVRTELINFLEGALSDVTDEGKRESFNPWVAATIAKRLAKYHDKEARSRDADRVVKKAGLAFEELAEVAAPPVAESWLSDLKRTYDRRGLYEDSKRVQLACREKGALVRECMQEFEVTMRVDGRAVGSLLASLTSGSFSEGLARLVEEFAPPTTNLRALIGQTSSERHVADLFEVRTFIDDHVAATTGPVEQDPDGQLRLKLGEWFVLSGPLLSLAIDSVRERFGLSGADLVNAVSTSQFFDPGRRPFLEAGFDAYLSGDQITAIHVLVPQLEHQLRRMLRSLDEPTDKSGRSQEGMQERNWNDILAADSVKECMPEALRLYLLVFFADPRGPNVRNRAFHGLLEPGDCTRSIADWVFHAALSLAHWGQRVQLSSGSTRGSEGRD